MKVAMMQPTFLPWMGYFALIENADVFVFLDNFQLSIQSFHTRNRLFIEKDAVGWYRVPILRKVSFGKPLNEARINESQNWRVKTIKAIKQNYRNTPYFSSYFPFVEDWLSADYRSLADLNMAFIRFVCNHFGWTTSFHCSSHYEIIGRRSKRILDILHHLGAAVYYSASGSFSYMHADHVFPVEDIIVYFQDFVSPTYPQTRGHSFRSNLSVLDALFNVGGEETNTMIRRGTVRWLTWNEMVCESLESKDS